ncbi:MAG TPA: DUF1707 domain-containing protein [Candidatus Dormibacteraeota bacterium]|jgi:hypothetical protein
MLASDADRDRVVTALKDAYVQGRLTHEELDQRLAAALRSRTIEETESLLDDLQPRPTPRPSYLPLPPPTYPERGIAPYLNWWPLLAIAVVVLAVAGGGHQGGAGFWWWIVFPAFFWFRGGRRRGRIRGSRL